MTLFVITTLLATKIRQTEIFSYKTAAKTRQEVVNRICLVILFLLLFAVSALRINTGNDYEMYINKFHDAYYDYFVVTEPGFNILVKLIYMLFNGEWYIIVFAVFSFFTVAFFIKAIYEQSEDFALSFFLFLSLGFYFQSLNTVRYYLALGIVLYSMKKINQGNYIKFLLLVLIASLFHKTALITIPLYLLAKINWKKWHMIIFALFASSGLFLSQFYLKIMLLLYPSYLEEEEYIAAGGFSLASIIKCLLVIIFALINYKEAIRDKKTNLFYFYLNLGALALYSCFSFVPFLSRIGYYLTVSQILFVPAIISGIKDEKRRKICKLAVVVLALTYFALFLYKASDDTIKILPYSSFLTEDFEIIAVDKIF